jgi:hypothetical protein
MQSKFILTLVAGFAAGLATVMACGDDAPGTADAQDASSCNCPASEPPLAARISIVKQQMTLAANSPGSATITCPENAILLTGSCFGVGAPVNADLRSAGIIETDPNSWACRWENDTATPQEMVALAKCLMPAQ